MCQADGTARAKVLRWECAWCAAGTAGKPGGGGPGVKGEGVGDEVREITL